MAKLAERYPHTQLIAESWVQIPAESNSDQLINITCNMMIHVAELRRAGLILLFVLKGIIIIFVFVITLVLVM